MFGVWLMPLEKSQDTARRKRWPWKKKEEIVAESMRPDVTVAEVAQKYGIAANLLSRWRSSMGVGCNNMQKAPAPRNGRKSAPASWSPVSEYKASHPAQEDIERGEVEYLHDRVAYLEDQVRQQKRQLQTLLSSIVTAQISP